ncbi:MAG TPA: fructosamine kinase family protein, partial [Spirochaetia bacterium]|nr:fructosamine kinase family protein [Spirochaetia bacterium]
MGQSDDLQQKVRELFGTSVEIREKRGVGGGCINQTSILILSDSRKVFLKENSLSYSNLFGSEAAGLTAIASKVGPAVPRPLAFGEVDDHQYLLLEHIEPGPKRPDFWEDFGRRVALLHRAKTSRRFGFEIDNYIGASPQRNGWDESWPHFFGRRRLEVQLKLALDAGHSSERWIGGLQRIIERIETLLPEPGQASLLHGDLWGGNFMVGPDGSAVLIDPAVYYGDREADLAMTELFGGFSARFYTAYREEYPIDYGYEERKELYNLYHLLNHFNLFGASYSGSVAA